MTSVSKVERTLIWLFTNARVAKTARIINVTTPSTLANTQEERPAAFTSMIFTRKSSLTSCRTVRKRLAKKSNVSTGAKLRKSSQRCCLSNVTRSTRNALSSAVGLGRWSRMYPSPANRGSATAPINAGIQNSLTFKISTTKSPIDFAVPLLTAILSPKREASKSVTRRPSRKLKITPHIQPNDSPLKNNASTLNGRGRHPKRTKESSATPMETRMNFRRPSLFSSEISLIPINLDTMYPNIWMMLVATL